MIDVNKDWDLRCFEKSLNQWVTHLVNTIDLTTHDSISHIDQLLSSKDSLWIGYDTCLNVKV